MTLMDIGYKGTYGARMDMYDLGFGICTCG